MKKGAKIALGILGAVGAGVVIGLLIAPENGKELRKKIKSKANGFADDMSSLLASIPGDAKETAKSIKTTIENKVNELKESISQS